MLPELTCEEISLLAAEVGEGCGQAARKAVCVSLACDLGVVLEGLFLK